MRPRRASISNAKNPPPSARDPDIREAQEVEHHLMVHVRVITERNVPPREIREQLEKAVYDYGFDIDHVHFAHTVELR